MFTDLYYSGTFLYLLFQGDVDKIDMGRQILFYGYRSRSYCILFCFTIILLIKTVEKILRFIFLTNFSLFEWCFQII